MQRVGLLVPSVNTVVEPEFWRLVPGTATVHSARMRNSTCDVDDSRQMLAHAERAADEVGSALVDVVAFACTASSFVDGRDGEAALHDLISSAANAPAITTSGAVAETLKSLGSRRVALYTPYPAELNDHEEEFLATHGIETVCAYGLGISAAVEIADVTSERTARVRGRAAAAGRRGHHLSLVHQHGDLRGHPAAGGAYGVPVVSSNSATFAAVARRLGWEMPACAGSAGRTSGGGRSHVATRRLEGRRSEPWRPARGRGRWRDVYRPGGGGRGRAPSRGIRRCRRRRTLTAGCWRVWRPVPTARLSRSRACCTPARWRPTPFSSDAGRGPD